jgi:predicted amidohydrolase YtcJ
LDQFDSVEAWLKEIGEFARLHPERDVIVGSGFLASSFGHDGPTRHLIDSVVPDRPVFIMKVLQTED